MIPVEFAKQHIRKIEEDMQKLHERHVKLIREIDEKQDLALQESDRATVH